MIRDILFRLPLSCKIALGRTRTVADKSKRMAIEMINRYEDSSFVGLNEPCYRRNLREFLYSCAYSANDTADYIRWLYTDSVIMIQQGELNFLLPTIICVVKNEADKLANFFTHYQALGRFNYIFIDNGSTDDSVHMMRDHGVTIYQCLEPFSTNRKLAWINKVYTTIPNDAWTILLDADELLVFDGYEGTSMNAVLDLFDKRQIKTAAAVMVDMFSQEPVRDSEYIHKYIYFENSFHEERSFYFNSVYGGIREREFKFGEDRIFLIKKHPVVKKESQSMLIHCHYIYPFRCNFESTIYFALLHYKLFDKEIEKYKRIADEGSYGNGSVEYKTYIRTFADKSYEQIFRASENTIRYDGTNSLKLIQCLHDIGELNGSNE